MPRGKNTFHCLSGHRISGETGKPRLLVGTCEDKLLTLLFYLSAINSLAALFVTDSSGDNC